ncbi:UNVERIFIED_CONTAM: hypothetical protein HDU68_009775 [Siphonaria sp. JEL0065]|nr:hypothetical protein HDU68_009775 [Siphonaria sp. JEL0065]
MSNDSIQTAVEHDPDQPMSVGIHEPLWQALTRNVLSKVIKVVETMKEHGMNPELERGPCDETILHVAVLGAKNGNGGVEVVEWILKNYGSLVNEWSKRSDAFRGETALHLAAMMGNLELVKLLVHHGAKTDILATGHEFEKETGALYYGQTVLQMAAAVHQNDETISEIVKFLVEEADVLIDQLDNHGNNVLHVLTSFGLFGKTFNYLKEKRPQMIFSENISKHTPFLSAIYKGHESIIDEVKTIFWDISGTKKFRLPLKEIDPLFCIHSLSAIEIAVEKEHFSILAHPIIETILKIKWDLYGRRFFMVKMFWTLLTTTMFVTTVLLQPSDFTRRRAFNLISEFRPWAEMFTFLRTLWMVGHEFYLFFCFGWEAYCVAGSMHQVFLIWVYAALGISLALFRSIGPTTDPTGYYLTTENCLFGAAAIASTCFLFDFAKGSRSLGPLALILKHILTDALPKWVFIYSILASGFTIAIYLQVTFSDSPTFGTFGSALLWILRGLMMQIGYSDISGGLSPIWSVVVYLAYGFLAPILLLNMMIALLGEVFGRISGNSVDRWRCELAVELIKMDRIIKFRKPMHRKIVDSYGLVPKVYVDTTKHEPLKEEEVKESDLIPDYLPPNLGLKHIVFVERDLRQAGGHRFKLSVAYNPKEGQTLEIVHHDEHDWWSMDVVWHDLRGMAAAVFSFDSQEATWEVYKMATTTTIAVSIASALAIIIAAAYFKSMKTIASSALHFRKGSSPSATYLKSPFSLNAIPSLKGKTAIVTGGNTGIGYQIVKHLALNGAKVFLAARSKERAEAAIAKLKTEARKSGVTVDIAFVKVDLSDLKQTKEAGIALAKATSQIDILVNNAGIMDVVGKDSFTPSKDGIEGMFATNHLGHFLFTKQLLPVILRNPSTPRIVVLSSSATWRAPLSGIDFASLDQKRLDFSAFHYYGQSKLANLLHVKQLNALYGTKVVVNPVHPGLVVSDLLRPNRFSLLWLLVFVPKSIVVALSGGKLLSTEEGAHSALFAATHPNVEQQNIRGQYIIPFGAISEDFHPMGSDKELAQKLWDYSEAVCGRM